MAADYVGSSLLSDAEINPPAKPRLPPELLIVPFGREGLLFEGARSTQLLTGASSRTLLPAVLKQLDGTKTWDEIASAIPTAPKDAVKNVLTLLFSCGLLEDGVSPLPAAEYRDLDAFLGRFVDVTRNNQNRGEAMVRLKQATIAIAGSESSATMIGPLITQSSAKVRSISSDIDDLDNVQLVLAVATQEAEDVRSVIALAAKRGIPALHVQVGEMQAQIGPLFIPGRTGCYDCMRTLYQPLKGVATPAFLPLYLSLAALQAVLFVSRLADVRLFAGFEAYEQTKHGLVHQHRYIARLPGCAICSIAGPPLAPASVEMLAWLYHSSVGMPPREVTSRRAHQRHYLAQNILETNREPDRYQGAKAYALPQIPLGETSSDALSQSGSRSGVSRASLAALLKCAAGHQESTDGSLRRIAPTGGGMGSPELFVIVRRVDDLPAGIYHYHAPRHVLEWLRDASLLETSVALNVRDSAAPCVIVGVGSLQKLRSKYHNFAYRIANLDAGIALRILHDVASAIGIRTREFTDFHDEGLALLIRAPRKDNQYVITFALALGVDPTELMPQFTTLGVHLLDELVAQSVLPRRAESPPRAHEHESLHEVPSDSLFTDLINRRSLRSFGHRPLPKSVLQRLASAAAEADNHRVRSGKAQRPLRQWWLNRVGSEGLRSGVYEFESGSERFVASGSDLTENDLRECLNQSGLAAAPCLFILSGHLGSTLGSRGARGYREILLQAGAMCGRVLIVAESLGVGACTTAGIIEYGFRRLSKCDGYNDCPLIAVALGNPPNG